MKTINNDQLKDLINYLDMWFDQCKYQYEQCALYKTVPVKVVVNTIDSTVEEYEKVISVLKGGEVVSGGLVITR